MEVLEPLYIQAGWGKMKTFEIEFKPASEAPEVPGDYLLYNQCDGYHIADARFEKGEFLGFYFFASGRVDDDFYCAWALLPDTVLALYSEFARKTPAC